MRIQDLRPGLLLWLCITSASSTQTSSTVSLARIQHLHYGLGLLSGLCVAPASCARPVPCCLTLAHPVLSVVPPVLCAGLLSGFMQCHSLAYKHLAALPSSKRPCLKSFCNPCICSSVSQASALAEVPTDLTYAALQQAIQPPAL